VTHEALLAGKVDLPGRFPRLEALRDGELPPRVRDRGRNADDFARLIRPVPDEERLDFTHCPHAFQEFPAPA